MTPVFITAFTLYGIAHIYLFLKVQAFLLMDSVTMLPLIAFLSFMTLSPLIIHLYSRRGSLRISRILAYSGYLWIAFVFYFMLTALSVDAYSLSVRLFGSLFNRDPGGMVPGPMLSFFVPSLLSVLLTTYGYFSAQEVRTEDLTLETTKLPEGVQKVTVAQISDLHLGIVVREKMLERIARTIDQRKPDIIVSTGDLLDGEINHVDELAGRLNALGAPLGKYAVTGNHEFFAGIDFSLDFLQKAGFRVLRNSSVKVQNILNIAGIDDPLVEDRYYGSTPAGEPEKEVLSRLPRDNFTLLLKHRPEIEADTLGLYDLQLSGHTHKGQMFPAGLVIQLFLYPHSAGFARLFRGSALYVSRGTGTTLCPVRLLALPEVTFIEIIRKKEDETVTARPVEGGPAAL